MTDISRQFRETTKRRLQGLFLWVQRNKRDHEAPARTGMIVDSLSTTMTWTSMFFPAVFEPFSNSPLQRVRYRSFRKSPAKAHFPFRWRFAEVITEFTWHAKNEWHGEMWLFLPGMMTSGKPSFLTMLTPRSKTGSSFFTWSSSPWNMRSVTTKPAQKHKLEIMKIHGAVRTCSLYSASFIRWCLLHKTFSCLLSDWFPKLKAKGDSTLVTFGVGSVNVTYPSYSAQIHWFWHFASWLCFRGAKGIRARCNWNQIKLSFLQQQWYSILFLRLKWLMMMHQSEDTI